jgi:hypothetical protein
MSSILSVKGNIVNILDVESGISKADKEWSKQHFVIDTGEKFNPEICFCLFGDKIDLLTPYQVGQNVEVFFNVCSREYKGKYYNSIDAWKIESGSGEQDAVETDNNDLAF